MKSLYEHCAERGDESLLRQWHPVRNNDLAPGAVAAFSHRKVWWRCSKGHEWQAVISSRTREKTGCPVCKRRRLLPGENDLATLFPDLAGQWHPQKNGNLMPEQVMPGSRRKIWWRCKNGHEWEASLIARTLNGTGCPYCAGAVVIPGENDLLKVYPEIAAQWHTYKNGVLSPENFSAYSSRKAWWQCDKGHEWQAVISSRTVQGSGCPYCAGRKVLAGFNDLATVAPRLAEQWHPELNGAFMPSQVTAGSHKKVWWLCPEGHVWKAVVASRALGRKCGCPVCAGRVREDRAARYEAAMANSVFKNGGSRV